MTRREIINANPRLKTDDSVTAYAKRLSEISGGQYIWDGMRCQIKRMRKEGLPVDIPIEPSVNNPIVRSTKRTSKLNWRKMINVMEKVKEMKSSASYSQNFANIEIDTKEPILVVNLADLHIGASGTDYKMLVKLTDEILNTPNLYVALNGDLLETAINLRNVKEVTGQLIDPEAQMDFLATWLHEIKHKVLWAVWDNHTVMREEKVTGFSMYKKIIGKEKAIIYSDGICHIDLKVGDETYKIVSSHRFTGRSLLNPTHGQQRQMRFESPDREIAMSGDSHKVGFSWYYDGNIERVAMNSGTLHTNSGYAKRHFSLFTIAKFPCIELYPDEHLFVPYQSVKVWKKVKENNV